MATIKSYTDIEQSRKLAEILPIESADMYWDLLSKEMYAKVNNIGNCLGRTCVCAWSLSALIGVLPKKLHIVLAIVELWAMVLAQQIRMSMIVLHLALLMLAANLY